MRTWAEIAALVGAGVIPSLAYLAVGLWLHRGLRLTAGGAERLALAYALGTGACSLAILGLRAADVAIPLLALAVIAAAGLPVMRTGRPAPDRGRASWIRAVDAATIAVALATGAAALAPETFWDGFEYHLPMIRAWSEGPIRALPAMIDSELRAGIDLLYLPAVSAGQPDAAAFVSACFAAALAATIRAEASRRASPGAGSLAGFFALLIPVTLNNAVSTYVDLGVGVYGFLALLCADRWNRGGETRTLIVSAVFLGLAANAKLHAAILCPAVLGLVLLGGRPPRPRTLAVCAVTVALLIAPWFVKAAATTGNPFFPLLGGLFGYGPSSAAILELRGFRLSTDFPFDRDLRGLLHYLASFNFGRNVHISGLVGPLPLALAPLALFRVSRSTALLAGAIAMLFLAQWITMPAVRFATPLLPFLAVAAAVGGCRIAVPRDREAPHPGSRAAAALLGVMFTALAIHHGADAINHYAPRIAALGTPRAYQRAVFPDQVALAEMVGGAPGVVAIPKGAVFWMPKPVYNLHWERNGELYFEHARPGPALALLRRRGVRSLVVDVDPSQLSAAAVGHPVIDSWLQSGAATLHADPHPPAARGRKVWIRIDLAPRRTRPALQ